MIKPVILAFTSGYSATELNKIQKLIEEHTNLIESSWNEYFG